ncbi:hypothetical protein ABPG74_019976 [Tetrahymena malaccensis]
MQTERQNGKLQIRNELLSLRKAFMQLNKIIIIIDRFSRNVDQIFVLKSKTPLCVLMKKNKEPFKEAYKLASTLTNYQQELLLFIIYKDYQQKTQKIRQLQSNQELNTQCLLSWFFLRFLQSVNRLYAVVLNGKTCKQQETRLKYKYIDKSLQQKCYFLERYAYKQKQTQHRIQGELKYVEILESQIKILNKQTQILIN